MPIEVYKSGGFCVSGPNAMRFFRMCQLRGALKMEIHGLRMRRGFSAYATIKREFGLKGTRESVLEQFSKLVDEESAKQTRVYEA